MRERSMSAEFEAALRELADEETPLTRDMLAMLSGPTRSECQALVDCLSGVSEERRREAVVRMVSHAEENFELDYADLFRCCLDDADPIVRRHAVEGLWEDEGTDLADPFLRMLSYDPDVEVRAAAATALGRFVFLAECEEVDQRCGAVVRDCLQRVIFDEEEEIEVTRHAVESIAYINDDEVRRIINWAYGHEDIRMRESAVFAMGRSAEPWWAETVLAELRDGPPSMRFEAARACGELGLEPAVGQLIELAAYPDGEVQEIALWALGQIGNKRARSALERYAGGDDEAVAAAARDALDELEFSSWSFDLMVHVLEGSDVGDGDTLGAGGVDEPDGDEPDSEEWPDDFLEIG
jgi:hypothetical protein